MTEQPLSRIERVELRTVWPDEAQDFTPWLAENIDVLGDVLGLTLESPQTEVMVGGYSLDILATDSERNLPVVIENQLESSDHDHLGKLLTYAAGHDASVMVWLAREFRDEHRQALEWLNQRIGRHTRFFAVTVEALKIDGSPPAPYFQVVASPSKWSRRKASDWRLERRYSAFRIGLEERLKSEGLLLDPDDDHSEPWMSLAGAEGLRYSVDFDEDIMLSFHIETEGSRSLKWCDAAFDRLARDKSDIESDLGQLEWARRWPGMENKGRFIISHYRGKFSEQSDPWDEVHSWAIETYRRFRDVFEPYRDELLKLPASGC